MTYGHSTSNQNNPKYFLICFEFSLSTQFQWHKQDKYHKEFLERYHHTVTRTSSGIVIIGGNNRDHNLCLYVEEGEEQGKVDTSSNVTTIKINKKWSPEVISAWLETIYTGKNNIYAWPSTDDLGDIVRNIAPNHKSDWEEFIKKYNVKRQPLHQYQQRIKQLALESDGLFGDITFTLGDSTIVTGHKVGSTFLES